MSKEDKPRIMIDRYGTPLGTPPEIYRDCIDNGKNEINHGNISNSNQQNIENQRNKNEYFKQGDEFYNQEQKTNAVNFNTTENYMNYDNGQAPEEYESVNGGYNEHPYSEEYGYVKQPDYGAPTQFYDDGQYDFSNYKQQQPLAPPPPPQQFQNQQPYYDNYDYNYFEGNGEQPLYVNIKQFHCIRKRKLRRDFLDTLMRQSSTPGYLHESRHRHAMNRMRAPSGRFLTKEETAEMMRQHKDDD